ncbi:NAD(P)/FAD-dependent oxidoreductase [Entomobacter blattae]|uniref:Gamma-glutamylputrescine oxidoreductase n=1 Tax=Entomobacter blattae TaxID=2762277 RepID=A0A7H1NQN5_9PROT|nr:FAD-binding oxidoreductase [Entomobacter blattae]QNT78095.1 Gamma-glutamylputrescine oxidoreductase [Entomobacter blattae]
MSIQKPTLLGQADFSITGYTSAEEWSCQVKEGRIQDGHTIPNYYEATVTPWIAQPTLEEDVQADVVVVGGGLLGVSAALHLARAGVDVALIERKHIGSGASGRNGGQLTPGLARWEAEKLITQFSEEEAKRLWRFSSFEAMDLIDSLTAEYGFEVDRHHGHITAAIHPGHIQTLEKGREARIYLGDDVARVMDREEIQNHVHSPLYFGGLYDPLGGHLHPLAFVRGLAYAFVKEGGRIFENSVVQAVEKTENGFVVKTPHGQARAKKAVILGVHHATSGLLGQILPTTMPLYSYVGLTAPVEGLADSLMPTHKAVYDTSFQIDYFRPVNANCFIFGGEGTGGQLAPEQVKSYLEGRLATIFPQQKEWDFQCLWSGKTDLTCNGAVDCRKEYEGEAASLYAVHGWSGHGIAQTVRIGQAISDDFLGKTDDFALLSSIRHFPIPFAEQISPFVIPLVKSWARVNSYVSPGKMISF